MKSRFDKCRSSRPKFSTTEDYVEHLKCMARELQNKAEDLLDETNAMEDIISNREKEEKTGQS